ncbi:hypothetical protein HU200_033898 [Digitaria exilis]|uniref:RING-type domain-containing protein n=1 Tax=Digitaria exilis TaxID=1010633 RepID=A0A835EKD1_9POAL|nr:hypothetical protein HU200_033898 [Digitaria exilis]
MRVCCGGGAGEHYTSGRGLLGAAVPEPSAPSFEAERAHLERALGVATTVLFLASVTYIALTTLFGCLCARGGRSSSHRRDAAEETKRALEEIPVVVVAVPARDPADRGGGDRVAGGAAGEEAPEGECAVCLGEYAAGEEVRVLPACRHGFHRECVDRWLLTRAPTCPVCRATVAARHEGRTDAKTCATGDGDAVLHVGP